MDQSFLMELLQTPSPSGQEMAIQKKWRKYVEGFADKIKTDNAGNVFGLLNPTARFKILLAGHCDEIGMVINYIEDNGFLRFTKVGGLGHKPAIGMKVDILGYEKRMTGVIGVNAEHHGGEKDEFGFEDLYIDCGAKDKQEISQYVQVGDLAVYKRKPEYLLNDRISGRGLDNRTGNFMIAEVLKNLTDRDLNVGVCAASTVNEETNMGGAYFAAAGIHPDLAIACDVTFATDYPGVDRRKQGEVDLDGGPVLAKGAPINHRANQWFEKTAAKEGINLQYELTPKMTGTDADRMRLTGKGTPISLVSLPLRYMHAPVETVSLKDMEDEIRLITETIAGLSGNESLNPLD